MMGKWYTWKLILSSLSCFHVCFVPIFFPRGCMVYLTYNYEQIRVHLEHIHLQQTNHVKFIDFIFIFLDLKFGYDVAQTCAHVCNFSHRTDNKKVCGKAKRETIYIYSYLFTLLTKYLVIGPITPSLQHKFFVACSYKTPWNCVQ